MLVQYDLYKKTRIEKDGVTDMDRAKKERGWQVGKAVLGIKWTVVSDIQHHRLVILFLQRHYIQTLHLAWVFIPFPINLEEECPSSDHLHIHSSLESCKCSSSNYNVCTKQKQTGVFQNISYVHLDQSTKIMLRPTCSCKESSMWWMMGSGKRQAQFGVNIL